MAAGFSVKDALNKNSKSVREEATEWLIQASKYRQIRAVINHK